MTKQTQAFQAITVNFKASRNQIDHAIRGLVEMIPDPWIVNDADWQQDVAKAKQKITVDVRPIFAGVKLSPELCEKRGIPITKEVDVVDYFQMLHAVFNKLNRLGMLTRKEWTEAPTGMPPGAKALPEGFNLQEYVDSLDTEGKEDA